MKNEIYIKLISKTHRYQTINRKHEHIEKCIDITSDISENRKE